MSHTTHEPEDTPLEEVLRSLPEEDPPEDLKARIVDALAEQRKILRLKPAKGQAWLPSLLAAAAVLVLVVSTQGPRMFGSGGGAGRLASSPTPAPAAMKASARASAAESKAPPPPAADELAGRVDREYRREAADSALPPLPAAESGPTPGYGLPRGYDAPETPWRDQSGERQSVTSSQLDLEVKDVEEAYDRTKQVLEKAHGIVLSKELSLRDRGPAKARITARVPVDQVDGVVSQLRDLGKVLRLSTDSADRTREYYGAGADIRKKGDTEDQLVAQYEAERNPQRKRELYQRIEDLRATMGREKLGLQDLSEQTHSVLLEITLTGRRGPGEFLTRVMPGIGQAILWVLATAVLWGPLALAAWLLRRRARSAG